MTSIPIFQDLEELHHASATKQTPMMGDFHIYRNEDAGKTCKMVMTPHRNNFFQISFDVQSNYQLKVNSQILHTQANKIYFAGLGKLISWESNESRSWKGFSIMFKPEFLSIGSNNGIFLKDFPFLRFNSHLSLDFSGKDQLVILDLCEKMLYEQNDLMAPNTIIIKHYLHIILLHLKRMHIAQYAASDHQKISREMELVAAFESLIDEHFLFIKSIAGYADKLFISSKHLSEVTKRVTGRTAKELIMNRVFFEATSLLKQTNFSVNQIAAELQFDDTSNFTKFFKRLSGGSPSDYRHKP